MGRVILMIAAVAAVVCVVYQVVNVALTFLTTQLPVLLSSVAYAIGPLVLTIAAMIFLLKLMLK